jgi:Na+/melibiose symporter-like transporter
MAGFFAYDTRNPSTPQSAQGYRFCAGIVVGTLFAICTILLAIFKLNKGMTIQMADELAARRENLSSMSPAGVGTV